MCEHVTRSVRIGPHGHRASQSEPKELGFLFNSSPCSKETKSSTIYVL